MDVTYDLCVARVHVDRAGFPAASPNIVYVTNPAHELVGRARGQMVVQVGLPLAPDQQSLLHALHEQGRIKLQFGF